MTYQEQLAIQKISALEVALKQNLAKPCLSNACLVAKAKNDLLNFVKGGK